MKRVPKPVFFIVALLLLAFTFTAVFGVAYYNGDNRNTVLKGVGDIRWGIDISGGVEATFKPANDYNATNSELDAAKAIIELRMVSQGITDYELYADSNNDRIIVRFPWKANEKNYDAAAAIEEISSTAELTFRPGNSYTTASVDADGNPIYQTPTGDTEEVLMTGKMVKDAQAKVQQNNDGTTEYVVELKLNDQGKSTFEEITTKYNGQTVSIWMDDQMISYPTVKNVISDGTAIISGSFTSQSAHALAHERIGM